MKSAAQLDSPSLESALTSSVSTSHEKTHAHAIEMPTVVLSPREIALNEYIELCNAIKSGKPAPRQLSSTKGRKSKASTKSSSASKQEESHKPSIESNVLSTRKKSVAKQVPTSEVPISETIASTSDNTIISKPKRTKKSIVELEPSSEPKETPKIEHQIETPSFPEPDLSKLPQKWQHDFELDWSSARSNIESKLVAYDRQLRKAKDFDTFAPLEPLDLSFWESSFEWDHQVNACASKYIQSAFISKAVLDPSSATSSNLVSSLASKVVFKPLQREAINMALARSDTLLALATGGGKTMCYVLPALLEVGLTIVISPLISLIQDQVTLLDSMGVSAAGLSGQMAQEELESVYDQLLQDTCPFKVVYATPERIARNARFMNTLVELRRRGKLQRIVIDEAHCISEWGHDFRKDYRRLSLLKERMPDIPIMAVTGTCTPTVRQDIAEQLGLAFSTSKRIPNAYPNAPPIVHPPLQTLEKARELGRYYVLQTSFNRPNLWFQVASKSPETPMADMLYYILNHGLAQECGIIFTMTTSDAERLAEFFAEQGLETTFYHGGMSPQARQASHAKWARGEAKLMCTTVAFGMGIDKSNVRYVLHSTMPTSLEAYYQQAGRAGRDGQPADCILFFQYKDRIKLEHVIKLHAHLAQQKQRVSEIVKLKEAAERKLLSEIVKKSKRKSRSKKDEVAESKSKDGNDALEEDDGEKVLKADDFDSEGFDSSMNIVDIVDIPEGESGLVRLLRADGSELLFNGFHPDYNRDVSEVVSLEDDPMDAFVRQIKTEKLDDVTSFCREKKTCRRVHLMRFFGQTFTKHQCDHTCDVCYPSSARTTEKLTRKGKVQWEALKNAREKRKSQLVSKPLAPIVAKLHDAIRIQEEDMAREANELAKKADELAYERQVSRKGKPSIPTRIGASSPLARKQRKTRFTTLGDPADYDIIREQLEQVELKPKRQAVVASLPMVDSTPAPTLTSSSLEDTVIPPEKSDSPLAALIRDTSTVPESSPISSSASPEESLIVPNGLDKLMDSIFKVSEAKAQRRSAAKNRKMSGGRFSTKKHVIHEEDEDGFIRTRTSFWSDFGSGDAFDDEIENELIEQVKSSTVVSTAALSPTTELSPPKYELASQLEEEKRKEHPSQGANSAFIRSSAVESGLLSDVRRACQRIAKDRKTVLKNVMSQRVMKELVEARPQTILQLAAVKGVGPRRAQWFSDYLLPIFKDVDE